MQNKIILIARKQFGYSNVYYHWCKYLSQTYDIIYFCPDIGLQKVEPKYKAEIIYYKFYDRNKILRNLSFLFKSIQLAKHNKKSVIIISAGLFLPLIKVFQPKNKYLLDIRVGHKQTFKYFSTNFYRFLLRNYCKLYKDITILSKNLADELNIPKSKYSIIPLGSEILSCNNKKYDNMNLLYIGTFNNRNILDTINGFIQFYHDFKERIKLTYTIIGFGNDKETNQIKRIIQNSDCSSLFNFVGRIGLEDRKIFFDKANIGVSYIPKTTYYDVQPPTKTFEYILSGMPVIATSTSENIKIINKTNGILINDTVECFYNGLVKLYKNRNNYNSEKIRESLKDYSWEKIVKNKLLPTIKKIIDE